MSDISSTQGILDLQLARALGYFVDVTMRWLYAWRSRSIQSGTAVRGFSSFQIHICAAWVTVSNLGSIRWYYMQPVMHVIVPCVGWGPCEAKPCQVLVQHVSRMPGNPTGGAPASGLTESRALQALLNVPESGKIGGGSEVIPRGFPSTGHNPKNPSN
jgi:hypothetical protein